MACCMPRFEAFRSKLLSEVSKINAKNRGIVQWCRDYVKAQKPVSAAKAIRENPFLRGCVHKRKYPVINAKGKRTRGTAGDWRLCVLSEDYGVPFHVSRGKAKRATALIVDEAGAGSKWVARAAEAARNVSWYRLLATRRMKK